MQTIFESSGIYFSKSFTFRFVDSSTDTGLRIKLFSGVLCMQLIVYTETGPPSRFQMLFQLIT
jgi:hypothetical protein